MIARLVGLFACAVAVTACAPVYAWSEDPPAVSIVADPLLRDRFRSQEEFEAHILDIVNRASLVFHADVGRRLVPGALEVGLPPGSGFSVESADAFALLAEKFKRRPSRFWVFLADRPLASCSIPGKWSGCALMGEFRSIVVYNSDIRSVVNNLLHEIGHNCGANHSGSPSSIMYLWSGNSATYGDKAEIIRKNCG